jgi:hypothetical protein
MGDFLCKNPVLRELAGRLQELETATNQANQDLKAAHLATAEGRVSAEHLLDHALASMEPLSEVGRGRYQPGPQRRPMSCRLISGFANRSQICLRS